MPRPFAPALLQLLSHATDPTRIQTHLVRCFEGVHRLRFRDANAGSPTRRRTSSRQLWSRLSGHSDAGDDDSPADARGKQWQDSLARASMGAAKAADLIVPQRGERPSAMSKIRMLSIASNDGAAGGGGGSGSGGGGGGGPRRSLAAAAMSAVLNRAKGYEAKAVVVPDLRIAGMVSEVGEDVALLRQVPTKARSVEAWMADFEGCMRDTVQTSVTQCVADYDEDGRGRWVEVRRGGVE